MLLVQVPYTLFLPLFLHQYFCRNDPFKLACHNGLMASLVLKNTDRCKLLKPVTWITYTFLKLLSHLISNAYRKMLISPVSRLADLFTCLFFAKQIPSKILYQQITRAGSKKMQLGYRRLANIFRHYARFRIIQVSQYRRTTTSGIRHRSLPSASAV